MLFEDGRKTDSLLRTKGLKGENHYTCIFSSQIDVKPYLIALSLREGNECGATVGMNEGR